MDRAALGYIQITPNRIVEAKKYLADLRTKRSKKYQTPFSRLYRLKSFFFKAGELDYMNYTLDIMRKYKMLQVVTPNQFHLIIDYFEKKYKKVNLNREFYFFNPTEKPTKFHELIVWAMRYDMVRSTFYIFKFRELMST